MRKTIAIGAPLILLAALSVTIFVSRSSPIEFRLLSFAPSGVVDADGNEQWLTEVTVSNLGAGVLQFEWGRTEVWCRVSDQWLPSEPMEILWNPRHLGARGQRDLMFLMPRQAEACRIRVSYQPELLQWRVWRRLGTRGQRFAGGYPSLMKRFWPQGSYGERPPYGRAFRNPPHWRRLTVEVPCPNQRTGGESHHAANLERDRLQTWLQQH